MTDLTFPNFNINIPTTNILWIVLVVATLIFVAVSAALVYHWRKYGMGVRRFIVVESIYIFVAILIVIMAVISILFV